MLKKLVSLVLTIVMLLSVGTTALAFQDENFSDMNNGNNLYISTGTVPQAVIDYAIENVAAYLIGYSSIDNFQLDDIKMGQPFTIVKEKSTDEDVYYFPIFLNNMIIYTFRVYLNENQQYTGILSPYLAQELNSYKNHTSITEPLVLLMDNMNLLGIQNDLVQILEKNHFNKNINKYTFTNIDFSLNDVVDITETIEFLVKPEIQTLSSQASINSRFLKLDMKETQGNEPWCAAYATASILRYKGAGEKITAEYIMREVYPDSKNLREKSLNREQIVTYAKRKGYEKTKEVSIAINNDMVVSEIENDTPIYLACQGQGSYKNFRHALVLCGYNNMNNTYTVWNPWYDWVELISSYGREYKVNSSGSYKWDRTIYQFRPY